MATDSNRDSRNTTSIPPRLLNGDEEDPPLPTSPKLNRTVQLSLRAEPATATPTAVKSAPEKPTGCWNDWRWQMRNRIRRLDQLAALFPRLNDPSNRLSDVVAKYPMAITPYYASLIRRADESDPIFQMAVPRFDELSDPPFLSADPLLEEAHMPVPGLIRRYPDRALVLATATCSMYCRHCTRKRVAGTHENTIAGRQMARIGAYLRAHPEISDVIVSGGDPFTLRTEVLEAVVAPIRQVRSVEVIRIGTRAPVVLPQRITDELANMLRQYHPIWVNTHFNHPRELTPKAADACARLADAGFPLGNQSVLLRGVNDDPTIMAELCRGLLRMRVRPYYLFQCDLVRGIEHFRTPLARGLEIMEYLRGRIGGLGIPTFVVDAPHGGGKIPVLPNYVVSVGPTHTALRNDCGMMVSYPEPRDKRPASARATRRGSVVAAPGAASKPSE
ncbi:MAG: KamA family radical SAM protein [Verrucomicrobiota bacterium]|nr:KamA family radical SAM protein [Verrucomicrobiota bacterium]